MSILFKIKLNFERMKKRPNEDELKGTRKRRDEKKTIKTKDKLVTC